MRQVPTTFRALTPPDQQIANDRLANHKKLLENIEKKYNGRVLRSHLNSKKANIQSYIRAMLKDKSEVEKEKAHQEMDRQLSVLSKEMDLISKISNRADKRFGLRNHAVKPELIKAVAPNETLAKYVNIANERLQPRGIKPIEILDPAANTQEVIKVKKPRKKLKISKSTELFMNKNSCKSKSQTGQFTHQINTTKNFVTENSADSTLRRRGADTIRHSNDNPYLLPGITVPFKTENKDSVDIDSFEGRIFKFEKDPVFKKSASASTLNLQSPKGELSYNLVYKKNLKPHHQNSKIVSPIFSPNSQNSSGDFSQAYFSFARSAHRQIAFTKTQKTQQENSQGLNSFFDERKQDGSNTRNENTLPYIDLEEGSLDSSNNHRLKMLVNLQKKRYLDSSKSPKIKDCCDKLNTSYENENWNQLKGDVSEMYNEFLQKYKTIKKSKPKFEKKSFEDVHKKVGSMIDNGWHHPEKFHTDESVDYLFDRQLFQFIQLPRYGYTARPPKVKSKLHKTVLAFNHAGTFEGMFALLNFHKSHFAYEKVRHRNLKAALIE